MNRNNFAEVLVIARLPVRQSKMLGAVLLVKDIDEKGVRSKISVTGEKFD